MRGWSSIFVAVLLLAVAFWSFAGDGFGSSTLICAAVAAFFFFRGAQGLSVGEAGDPSAVIDFVTDPADAIVDTATDRLSEWIDDRPKAAAAADQPGFDADAALARYMAQREREPAAAPAVIPASAAPARSFGRKGL